MAWIARGAAGFLSLPRLPQPRLLPGTFTAPATAWQTFDGKIAGALDVIFEPGNIPRHGLHGRQDRFVSVTFGDIQFNRLELIQKLICIGPESLSVGVGLLPKVALLMPPIYRHLMITI